MLGAKGKEDWPVLDNMQSANKVPRDCLGAYISDSARVTVIRAVIARRILVAVASASATLSESREGS